MGAGGYTIFENDIACDIRNSVMKMMIADNDNTYRDVFKQFIEGKLALVDLSITFSYVNKEIVCIK